METNIFSGKRPEGKNEPVDACQFMQLICFLIFYIYYLFYFLFWFIVFIHLPMCL